MDLQEICKKLNINYTEVLGRFGGNETIYKKFLKKFLDDPSYDSLENAWNQMDYREIEKNAHTLKGVSGNLGIEGLFIASNELVQIVRKEKYEEVPQMYEELKKEYKRVKEIIKNLE